MTTSNRIRDLRPPNDLGLCCTSNVVIARGEAQAEPRAPHELTEASASNPG